jgi:serine protease Do
MNPKIRYWSFVGLLCAGVAVAVSTMAAQGASARRESDGHREVRVFDGHGSRLGVMVRDLDSTDTGAAAGGVRVQSVDDGSPAGKAGMKAGDVIVEYDGERVRSTRQFTRLVQETAEGRQVPLAVLRNGQRQMMTAAPEARGMEWNFDIDADQLHREVERGLEGMRAFRLPPSADGFPFDDLPEAMMTGRGRLGVSVDSLTDQLAQYFGAADGGALVTAVRKDSAADKAGLKAGDVITAVNGERVRDAGDVTRGIGRIDEGTVSLDYLRDKKSATAKATLEPREGTRESRAPRRMVRPVRFTEAR